MKLEIAGTEVTANVLLAPEDIKQLPKTMQDCYNGLCKYAKPDSIEEISLQWICNDKIECFCLFFACRSEVNDFFTVVFDEGEDYILTEQERTTLRNMYVELIAKTYMREGVAKCV